MTLVTSDLVRLDNQIADLSRPKVRPYVHPYEVIKDLVSTDLEGAKVTLINMPIREQAKPNNAPLGPGLLAARLLRYGVEVNIVDLNAYRIVDDDSDRRGLTNGRTLTFQETEVLLGTTFDSYGDQDLIGFSGLITTLLWQKTVAKIVRRLQPQAMLVSGGGLATEFRETLFEWIPELNGFGHSEGDDVILKMAYDAKLIREKGLEYAVQSGHLRPYFSNVLNGHPRFHYDGGRPPNLDRLPFPAWELLEQDVNGFRVLDMYLDSPIWGGIALNSSAAPFTMDRSINTVSSRGCPFACKFCFRGAQGERDYGVRSAENLASEMALYLDKYEVDFVGIVDDNFMVNPNRIVDLVPVMKSLVADKGLRWGTHGRLDEAADLRPTRGSNGSYTYNAIRRVDSMAESGCVYIGFGAESASPTVLESMGKGGFILSNGTVKLHGYELPRTMVEGIKNTHAAEIHGNCTWIMAYPGETLEDLKTTVAFIKWQEELYTAGKTRGTSEHDLALNSVNKAMFVATAYPGAEMFGDPLVQEKLGENFGINFDRQTGSPIVDDNLYQYVLQLNDATQVLYGKDGQPLNFSRMSEDTFLQAQEYVNHGNIYEILDM